MSRAPAIRGAKANGAGTKLFVIAEAASLQWWVKT
jgi:hypothetical protein